MSGLSDLLKDRKRCDASDAFRTYFLALLAFFQLFNHFGHFDRFTPLPLTPSQPGNSEILAKIGLNLLTFFSFLVTGVFLQRIFVFIICATAFFQNSFENYVIPMNVFDTLLRKLYKPQITTLPN